MQRVSLSLCLLYAFSVLGIALSMHYCGGKLADVSLFANETSCKLCKDEPVDKKDDGCCKNTNVDLKVKDSHQIKAGLKLPQLFEVAAFLPARIIVLSNTIFSQVTPKLANKAPPLALKVSYQILFCVFRN